ncbi:MAG: helix-turn-helix transcriptional regulator [Lysobacter sp.]|nr:helix-turn-helix transcriptional regulator [Lysobacter sp.]
MATTLSVRLRRLRKSSSLTMEGLAQAAGISKSYVWELENREVPHLSAKVLVDLAKALGVTIQDLLGEPPPVKASPEDLRFFRKYVGMDRADKDRLRKMVDLFDQPAAKHVARAR